jgi:DNA-directed RNA polymerase subunit beta'
MLKTTLGQLLVNDALPEDMRDYNRVLDKKNMGSLATELAQKHPDKYREIMKKLHDVALSTSYTTGGLSFGLNNIRSTLAAQNAGLKVKKQLRQILADTNLSEKDRTLKILKLASDSQKRLVEDVFAEAKDTGNPLAYQVLGSGVGNKFSLNSLIGADLQYVDHKDEPIPLPVLRSYGRGLTPAEYFAAAFGARKGVIDVKTATADAGFYGKQLTQLAHRLLVTADDDDDEERLKRAENRGLPAEVDDPDNEGSLLARPVGPYKRNTVLTPKILRDIKAMGVDDILVRSPTVGGPEDGGVYAKDVGYREKSRIPPVGDYVGIAAAQAISEPVSQSQLSSKHSGGVGGAKSIGGFKAINALVQVPKKYPDGATHAQKDGRVQEIRPAAQGGFYVQVDGEDHYVPADREVSVKKGDVLEAGDVVSDGMPNPAEIVRHKGVGEGRKYFVSAMRNVLKNSGVTAHRRNIELVARGLINHVRLTDEYGDYAPNDVVPYSMLERNWQPRQGAVAAAPKTLLGHYLEEPVLHYSVGTRITKSVADTLQKYNVQNVQAHKEPPPFEPEMVRGMANISNDPDWMTRMLGSYQERGLLNSVHKGLASDTNSSSYVPALARGEQFGLGGATSGWKPDAPNTLKTPAQTPNQTPQVPDKPETGLPPLKAPSGSFNLFR